MVLLMRDITSVFVAATGKNDRKIFRIMSVRVAQIATEKNGRVIQEPPSLFRLLPQLRQQLREH